jgi:hypothetical protein
MIGTVRKLQRDQDARAKQVLPVRTRTIRALPTPTRFFRLPSVFVPPTPPSPSTRVCTLLMLSASGRSLARCSRPPTPLPPESSTPPHRPLPALRSIFPIPSHSPDRLCVL